MGEKQYKVIEKSLTLKKRIAEPGDVFNESEFIGGESALKEAIKVRCEYVKGTGGPELSESAKVKKLNADIGDLESDNKKLAEVNLALSEENKKLKNENDELNKLIESDGGKS